MSAVCWRLHRVSVQSSNHHPNTPVPSTRCKSVCPPRDIRNICLVKHWVRIVGYDFAVRVNSKSRFGFSLWRLLYAKLPAWQVPPSSSQHRTWRGRRQQYSSTAARMRCVLSELFLKQVSHRPQETALKTSSEVSRTIRYCGEQIGGMCCRTNHSRIVDGGRGPTWRSPNIGECNVHSSVPGTHRAITTPPYSTYLVLLDRAG